MSRIIFIKQKITPVAKYYGLDELGKKQGEEGAAVNPGARHSYSPRVETDRTNYITGLWENSPRVNRISDPKKRQAEKDRIIKERAHLEALLGVDLGPQSTYWDSYRMNLVDRASFKKKLDLDQPEDLLLYTVALANNYLAKEYDDLNDPAYTEVKAFLYVYNPTEQSTRKQQLQDAKDDIAGLIAQHKNNQDKLFYWCVLLNKGVSRNYTKEELKSLLSAHRETLKTLEDHEAFLEKLSLDNQTLQLIYLIRLGIRKKKIQKVNNQYVLDGQELGRYEMDAVNTLKLSENAYLLDTLQELDPEFA